MKGIKKNRETTEKMKRETLERAIYLTRHHQPPTRVICLTPSPTQKASQKPLTMPPISNPVVAQSLAGLKILAPGSTYARHTS